MRVRARAALLTVALALSCGSARDAQAERLLFVGDVLLSRQVEEQIRQRATDPWRELRAHFAAADWVGGNLEGAVGEHANCNPRLVPSGTCFAVPAALLARARDAGFSALAVENNHRADLGAAGRGRTRAALAAAGMRPLSFEDSPVFVRAGNLDLAVIALSRVPDADGALDAVPSVDLARKLRLARALAQVTVVSVHWGRELVDWPDVSQRADATWLVEHGADVIVGHHPHVIQPAECVAGRPVYFSLGNHLFDQKYPETKRGRIADCRLVDGELRCGALATEAEPRSTTPALVGAEDEVGEALAACPVPLREPLHVNGFAIRALPAPVKERPAGVALAGRAMPPATGAAHEWHTRPAPLLSAQPFRPGGDGQDELLFALEAHASPLDERVAPRPYVYAVSQRGLTAKWRGSGLAWPLTDAIVLPSGLLCALHEGTSFLEQAGDDSRAAGVERAATCRVALYRWNGFGFSGVDDPAQLASCASAYPPTPAP